MTLDQLSSSTSSLFVLRMAVLSYHNRLNRCCNEFTRIGDAPVKCTIGSGQGGCRFVFPQMNWQFMKEMWRHFFPRNSETLEFPSQQGCGNSIAEIFKAEINKPLVIKGIKESGDMRGRWCWGHFQTSAVSYWIATNTSSWIDYYYLFQCSQMLP